MATPTKKRKKKTNKYQTTLNELYGKRFEVEGLKRGYIKEADNLRRIIVKIFNLIDKGVVDDY